jgi:DNA-binding NtrC family response regulator
VDHDESVLEAVGTILRGRDHRVQTARDVSEARAMIEKHEFDLVIADLHVYDGSNGNGLGAWLARNKPSLSRRLIWMCAVAPSGDAGEKIAANGRPILQKPFKASELLSAVDDLLLAGIQTAAINR